MFKEQIWFQTLKNQQPDAQNFYLTLFIHTEVSLQFFTCLCIQLVSLSTQRLQFSSQEALHSYFLVRQCKIHQFHRMTHQAKIRYNFPEQWLVFPFLFSQLLKSRALSKFDRVRHPVDDRFLHCSKLFTDHCPLNMISNSDYIFTHSLKQKIISKILLVLLHRIL